MSRKDKRPKRPERLATVKSATVRHGRLMLRRDALSVAVLFVLMISWLVIRYEPVTAAADADLIVYASSSCSCYRPWIRGLRREGIAVSVVHAKDVAGTQASLGVPREFAACHTAIVNDYWIEGHVPATSISDLLLNNPEGVGGLAHLRAPVRSGDTLSWEVVIYDAEGRPKSNSIQDHSSAVRERDAAHRR